MKLKNKTLLPLMFTCLFVLAGCSEEIPVGSPEWCDFKTEMKSHIGVDSEMWKEEAAEYEKYCEK